MKKFTPFLIAVIMLGFTNYIIAQTRNPNQYKDQDKEKLEKLAEKFHQKFLQQRAEVERVAQEKGWAIREETEDGVREIQYISPNGMPQYYTTHNLNAARTINTDDLWVGGSSGLNLTGSGFTAGEWDGGGVRLTHQEFDGRVTQKDSPGATSYHSTHVAGTIVAQGQVNAAHGMAYEAELDAYDWTDDVTEMTNAASGGLTLSNHSYGYTRGWYNSGGTWYWYGNPSISSTEDYLFGFYDSYSQGWDQIAYNAPHYLVCKSSGNDRNDDHSGGHYYWNGTSWVYSTASRDPDGGADGYDCIDQLGVSKNILTVGAVEDITGGWTQPSDVVMSSFSSWGPTDDGRIKPDLVANGVYLYSTDDDADNDYTTISGTSMSTPSVTGTLALLQDYYESLRGGYMSAAALKGLAINTANEAGPADGPDYMFGWGLMNATGAAGLITDDDTEGGLIVEGILENGQTIDYTYYSDGTTDINVTLCWTDPAGTPPAASLNPTTSMLVNELDLKIYDEASVIYYAWKLNPYIPSSAATHTQENWRDNVEVVNIQSPSAGYYTLRVDHDGTLSGGDQAYAMIVTGMTTPPTDSYCDARHTSWSVYEYIENVALGDIDNTTGRSAGGFHDFTGLVTEMTKSSSQTIFVTIHGYSGDQGIAWVDWNQDGDFYDTGEEFVLGSGAGPVYSTTITAPSGAVSGYTTMRVRLTYNSTPTPCGTFSYGETEDYTIKVTGTPGLWTGAVSTDWHTAGNWDDGSVPSSTVDVTIPSGTPYQPTISSGNAYCEDLIINSGATLTQTGGYLRVYGSFNSDYGTFTQSGSSYLYFYGATNTYWDDDNMDDTYRYVRILKSNSTDQLSLWQHMTIEGNFEIREGTFLFNSNWTLTINSTSSNAFEVQNGGILQLSNTQTIDVAGDMQFLDGSQANVTGGTIRCGDEFRVYSNAAYDIQFTGGTVEIDGTSTQFIDDQDGNTEFYDLIINKSAGTCYLYNGDLVVNNNLTITAGSFTLNGYEATVAHDCDVYGTLNMTNAADVLNIGTSSYDNLTFYSGSTGNISNGEIYLKSWITTKSGCSFTASTNNTIYFTGGNSSGGLANYEPSAVYGNVDVNKSAYRIYLSATATEPHIVNGNFVIHAGNILEMVNNTLTVHGYFTDNATSEVYVYSAKKDGLNGTSSDKGISAGGSGAKGGYLEIDNDFTLNGLLDVADGDVLLHGDFHIASTGTLDITTGTVIADQSYKGKAWQNLYGTINLTAGLFEISHNSMKFSSTSVNNISGGIMRCGYTFYASSAGIFQPSGGTVEITGSDPNPYILCSHSNNNYFHNLLIDRANIVVLFSDIEVKNDLTIENGPFTSWYLTDQYDIYIGGDWTNNGGDAAFDEGTGTVIFNGAGDGDILTTEIFYRLTLDKTYTGYTALELFDDVVILNDLAITDGTMELNSPADLYVLDDLVIQANAGLNANDIYSLNIYIGGDWLNYNTGYGSTYGFHPGTYSTVTFNGSTNQYLLTSAAIEDFNNVVINKSAGQFRPYDNTQILGNLTITDGEWNDNVSSLTHYWWEDVSVSANGAWYTSGNHNTVVFKGTDDQTFEYLHPGAGYFYNVIVDKTITKDNMNLSSDEGEVIANMQQGKGGKAMIVTFLTDIDIQNNGTLLIGEGTLDLNGNMFKCTGNVTIENGGTLTVDSNAELCVGGAYSLEVQSGGTLEVIGTVGNEALVTHHTSGGYYSFDILSGGTISAEYGIFEYMTANGVFVNTGAIIDATHTFNNCTFQNGTSGNAALMVINNNQTLTIDGANFPTNTWGGDHNVWKGIDQGNVTFTNVTGDFAGPAYEHDPYDRIDWPDFLPGLWIGAVSSDWHTPGNWDDFMVPDATVSVAIPAGTPNDPVVSGSPASCADITIDAGASLTIDNNSLDAGSLIDIYGELIMNNAAGELYGYSIYWQSGSTDNVTAGTIYIDYICYFYDGTNAMLGPGNTVVFNSGLSASGIICWDADAELGSLVIDKSAGSFYIGYTSTEPCRISGNLTVTANNYFYMQDLNMIVDGVLNVGANGELYVASAKDLGISKKQVDEEFTLIKPELTEGTKGGNLTLNSDFTLNGLLDVGDGNVLLHGVFTLAGTGSLIIDGGTFIADAPLHAKGWEYLHGNLSMTDGLFEISYNSVNFSSTASSSISGGIIRSGEAFRAGDAGVFEPTGGVVEIVGVGSNTIYCDGGCYFYDLLINRDPGASSYLYTEVTVTNDLTINSGILNCSYYDLYIDGDCNINALMDVGATGNVLNHGLFELGASGTLTIDGGSFVNDHPYGTEAWQYLHGTLNLSAGLFEIMHNSILLESTFVDNISGGTMRTGHSFRAETAGTFEPSGGKFEFTGTQGAPFIDCDAGNYFNDFDFNSSVDIGLYANTEVRGNATIDNGLLNFYSYDLSCLGNVDINSGGTMLINDNATLKLDGGSALTVAVGGEIQVVGTAGNEATVTHISTGTYSFSIFGTIGAQYAIFEYMDGNGIYVKTGGIVDATYTFNNCVFHRGSAAPSALLVLNNDQVFTCNNAYFENTFGTTQYNVWKYYDTGDVTFVDATGFFAGPAYEYDPYSRVDWTGFTSGLWTGVISSDWFTPENWDDYIIPDVSINVTIPAGTPNNPVVSGAAAFCNEFYLESGASIEIVDNQLTTGYCNLYGQLIMNNSAGVLHTSTINWQAGSSDNVTAGEIYAQYWYWQDGTNAQLGTGNTAYIKSSIGPYDADASYGNLVITPTVDENGGVDDKGSYPIRVSGDCLMQSGIAWQTPVDWYIDGSWEIENGASFRIHSGALGLCDQDFTLDGELELDPTGSTLVHGMFYFGASGILDIDGASFTCDYYLPAGWMILYGSINMTTGLLEFSDGNVSFSGTSTIADGIVRAGRTIKASAAGAFQPSGGTLELIGSGGGHYIRIINGNYVYDLNVNRTNTIMVYSSSPLTVQNDLTVNSALNSNNNTITVNGNIDVNSGGTLNMEANGTLEIGSGHVLNVNSGGTLSVVGTSGNETTVTHIAGYYNLNVMNGGTISAEYGIFEYMASAGINLMGNAIVDAGHPFDNCLFRNGTAGGRLFTVNAIQNFTVNNAVFPTNTWGGAYNVYKSVDAGVVNFNSATGGFQGEAYDYDPFNRIHWTVPSFDLDLTVFLEGPFNPSTNKMDTDVNGILPTIHPFQPTLPYFGNPMPDWYYTGSESVPTIPNPWIVGWVLVELRDATSAATALPGTMIAQQAAFVLNTGEVVDLNGGSLLNFTATVNSGLYVVIWQRNHLGVISANALVESGGVYTYNFSSGSGQAYGGASAQKNLGGSGIWGMMSGDGDGDGDVKLTDKVNVWEIQAGTAGYLEGDFNMNVQVNNPDKNDYWLPNLGGGSYIPE